MKINPRVIAFITIMVLASCSLMDPDRNKEKLQGKRIAVIDRQFTAPLNADINRCDSEVVQKDFTLLTRKKIDRYSSAGLVTQPLFVDNKLIVLTSAGILTAYNKSISEVIWQQTISTDKHFVIIGRISTDNKKIYLSIGTNHLFAFDIKTGNRIWTSNLDDVVRSSPIFDDNKIYIHTAHNHLYAVHPDSGQVIWRHIDEKTSITTLANTIPVVIGDQIAMHLDNRELLFLDKNTGTMIGFMPLSEQYSHAIAGEDHSMHHSFKYDQNRIYKTSKYGQLMAIDTGGNGVVWSHLINMNASFALDQKLLYVIADRGILASFDKYTGKLVWATALPNCLKEKRLSQLWTDPIIDGNSIITISQNGTILGFNKKTGKVVRRLDTNIGLITSNPVLTEDNMYVISNNGYIYQYAK